MAGETNVTLVGNVVADPELRFTPSGAMVTNFTVASTPRSFDKQSGDWVDGDPLFVRCAIWKEPAENVSETLTKGMRVIVTGALRHREFERKDGSKDHSLELDVQEVGPSLRYAQATVMKATRGRPAARQQPRDPWAGKPVQPDEPPF